MSCNCKHKNINQEDPKDKKTEKGILQTTIKYTLKFLGFLLLLVMLPILNLFIIWFMFDMIVLNSSIDLRPLLLTIGKKIKWDGESEEYEDYSFDDLTEDDVILENLEDLKK
jgi:hypothetical protein